MLKKLYTELLSLNEFNVLFSFSTLLILASFVTLSDVMDLIFNYYIKLYGD